MSEGKSINLLKAAKELNIGLSTAVEFLGKKGFKVDPKPNTKLNEQMYDVLLKEYQGDKNVKEEAKQIAIGKIRRDDLPSLPHDKPENIRANEFEQEEILIKNAGSFSHPPVEKPKPVIAPSTEKIETTEPEKEDDGVLPGVKVIGRINLDELNGKNRPEKKIEDIPPAATIETAPEITSEVSEIQVTEPVDITPTLPGIQDEQDEPDTPTADTGEDVVRAKAERLTGPNVIGRIDLSSHQRRKDQPVASSSNLSANDQKRKRKRKDGNVSPAPSGQRPAAAPGASPQVNRPDFRGSRPAGGPTGAPRPDFRNKTRPETPKEEPSDKQIQDQNKLTDTVGSFVGKYW